MYTVYLRTDPTQLCKNQHLREGQPGRPSVNVKVSPRNDVTGDTAICRASCARIRAGTPRRHDSVYIHPWSAKRVFCRFQRFYFSFTQDDCLMRNEI